MEGKFSIRNVLGRSRRDSPANRSVLPDVLSRYKDKITTPENALSKIKSGDRIFLGTGCATPRTLALALENLDKVLDDVQIYHFMVKGAIPIHEGVLKTSFFHKAFFVDSDMRENDNEAGRGRLRG
jgi:acyl-CoA hydrolase